MSFYGRRIKALLRRRTYLLKKKLLTAHTGKLSFIQAELSATDWAISIIRAACIYVSQPNEENLAALETAISDRQLEDDTQG